MSNPTTRRQALLRHLDILVREQKPFTYATAAAVIGCGNAGVRYNLDALRKDGVIETNFTRVGNDYDYSITIIGVGSTVWNDLNGRRETQCVRAREELAKWQERTGWSLNQIGTAMSTVEDVSGNPYQIGKLMNGEFIPPDTVQRLLKFIRHYANPGSFERWRDKAARTSMARKVDERDEIFRRVEQVEREREERRRALLAAERRPREIKQREYLDKATMAALSGQIMGMGASLASSNTERNG